MAEIISRRVGQLSGEANESNYEAGRYFVAGQDVGEYLDFLQRDVFAFVADQNRPVMLTYTVECGLENDLDLIDTSGVARFVAFQATSNPGAKPITKKSSFSIFGEIIESGPGNFYLIGEDKKESNINALILRATAQVLDKYSEANASVTINFDVSVSDEDSVIV